MENNKVAKSGGYDDELDVFMEQFFVAMNSLQLQDIQGSEQAYLKAQRVYNKIVTDADEDDSNFMKITINFIQTTSLFLKANFYLMEERFKKSMDSFVEAKQICDDTSEIFKQYSGEEIDDLNFDFPLATIKFLFAYYNHIIVVFHAIVQKSLDIKDGKYVDEIDLNRKAAAELRRFKYDDYHIDDEVLSNLIVGVIGFINRTAETLDKKAERLEEARKVIKFMQPTDKKVFIVHGHDEGVLRELKEILEKNFKIDPVILRDESDIGKTIIEKIEDYGRQCAFTIVIITPDDLVENKKKKIFQARPNVLFELGWFCGRYGRNKVRILRQKDTPLPSDLGGLLTLDFDKKVSEVFLNIKTDLETAGIIE